MQTLTTLVGLCKCKTVLSVYAVKTTWRTFISGRGPINIGYRTFPEVFVSGIDTMWDNENLYSQCLFLLKLFLAFPSRTLAQSQDSVNTIIYSNFVLYHDFYKKNSLVFLFLFFGGQLFFRFVCKSICSDDLCYIWTSAPCGDFSYISLCLHYLSDSRLKYERCSHTQG